MGYDSTRSFYEAMGMQKTEHQEKRSLNNAGMGHACCIRDWEYTKI